MANNNNFAQAIADYQSGFSLPACLYNDKSVFQRDVDSLFLPGWIYACHQSELKNVGSYILLNAAGESVIVVRSSEAKIEAHFNVCRHRGSRVCLDQQGSAKNFVCPYHGWTYGLDGKLLASREMPKEFDKSSFGLKAVNVAVVHGLVFVNLNGAARDFAEIAKPITPALDMYHIENTKVAFQDTWNVEANWKLALENFMECYHCAPAHPEYARAHSLKLPARLGEKLYAPLYEKCAALGINHEYISTEPGGDSLLGIFHRRQPLLDGYVTGSEDGKPLAPLLGNMPEFDGGASDIQLGLFCYGLIYADHIVLYSFLPLNAQSTDMKIVWLVRDDAQEGKDYDVERLTWLWRVTTDADKTIILNNQLGVNSRYYEPGPYSEMEEYAQMFADWYVQRIAQ